MSETITLIFTFLSGIFVSFLPKLFDFLIQKKTLNSNDFKYLIQEYKKENISLRERLLKVEEQIIKIQAENLDLKKQSLKDKQEIDKLRKRIEAQFDKN
jgi:predicted RNase H-like nuclease (RuvC/YqgF family)